MSNRMLPIGKLFNLEKGALQSTKCTPGEFDFITAAEEWKTHSAYSHECEALVFAAAASGSLGRTHYVDGKFTSSDLCFILTPKDEEKFPLNLGFYHFVFNSLRPNLVATTKSGTSKESINQTNLKNYEIPYFDIEQQDFWTNKLKNTMGLKGLLDSELSYQGTLIRKLHQQLLQEAIEGKLTCDWRAANPDREPASTLLKRIADEKAELIKAKKIKQQKPLPPISEIEKPFDLPDGWEWCRLSDLFLFIDYRGKTPKKITSGVRLITARNVRLGKLSLDPEDFISEKEYEERMTRGYPKYGDLLFTTEAPLGNVCLLTAKDEKISTGQRLITFQSYSEGLPNILFMFFMLSPFFQEYLLKNATGVTAKGIKANKLKDVLIPIPPADEQQAIIAKVEKLLATCNQLEMQINSSQIHTDALMQAVLREAFSHTSESDKVVDVQRQSNIAALKPERVDYYKQTLLAAEVVD